MPLVAHIPVPEPQFTMYKAEVTWDRRDCPLEVETRGAGHARIQSPFTWFPHCRSLSFPIFEVGVSRSLEAKVQR